MRNRIKVLFWVVFASVAFQVFGKPNDPILDHLDGDGDGILDIDEFRQIKTAAASVVTKVSSSPSAKGERGAKRRAHSV